MSKTMDINVHHVTRVEGHGNIVVKAKDGKVQDVQWQVPEAPRFFEGMIRGRSFEDIQTIVSRICGICSITHSLASTKAVEDALGVEVSEQDDMLRILMHYSEQLQSHVLHVGYLVAPDLFGEKSVVPLVSKAPDAVKTIIRAHRIANNWGDLQAGRPTHPITMKVGGWAKIPTEAELRELQDTLKTVIMADLKTIADVVLSAAGAIPNFTRDTEYVALKQVNPPTYTFYHGDITSTDKPEMMVPVQQWESVANEYVNAQSTSKWCKWNRGEYAVGALARFNVNAELLSDTAKAVAGMFGLEKGCCNPYMNSVAQIVEAVHVVETSIEMIDTLLTKGLTYKAPKVTPKAGKGSGCVEAPRGILFHTYEFDDNGNCTGGNICIPTGQNHGNMQADLEKLVPEFLDEGEDAVRLKCEMLIRSYDPCISCSTHKLNVQFINE